MIKETLMISKKKWTDWTEICFCRSFHILFSADARCFFSSTFCSDSFKLLTLFLKQILSVQIKTTIKNFQINRNFFLYFVFVISVFFFFTLSLSSRLPQSQAVLVKIRHTSNKLHSFYFFVGTHGAKFSKITKDHMLYDVLTNEAYALN